jgi:hypothetical protein
MGKFTNDVDEYARRSAQRHEESFHVHIDQPVRHGTAGDANRGMDGHGPDARWEEEPVPVDLPAVQRGREVQRDLRGKEKDARSEDQSTTRYQNTKG